MKTFDVVMDRIKNLKLFEVMVDVPEGFQFYGAVPFDMSITGGKAFVKVVAVDIKEAVDRVNEYFSGPKEEEF